MLTAVIPTATPAPISALPAAAPIQQLHRYAHRAKDAEETRHFYADILGLPLHHIIQSDHVPSTGDYCPYTHFFFRLQAENSEVLGVADHHVFKSIYFFDPNGTRLELTAQLASQEEMERESHAAHARLAEWTARKAGWRKARAEGRASQPRTPGRNDRPEFSSKK